MNRITFDRVAEIYDATRGHPPEVSQRIAASVGELLAPEAQVLEIGVGTGRIARPLAQRGLKVSGLDISRPMMARLLAQSSADANPVQLVEGDVTRMPFAGQRFDAVIAVHVFHLIEDWQQALNEVRRVLAPQGILLAGHDDRDPNSAVAVANAQWTAILQRYAPAPARLTRHETGEIVRYLQALGAEQTPFVAANWEGSFVPERYIAEVGSGTYSSSWHVDPSVMTAAVDELRQWAQGYFGDLTREIAIPRHFVWEVYRWT